MRKNIRKLIVEYVGEMYGPKQASIIAEKVYLLEDHDLELIHESVGMKTFLSAVGLFLGFPFLWGAYKAIQLTLDKCTKECSTSASSMFINTAARQACVSQCKMKQIQAELNLLKQTLAKCPQSPNPERCEQLTKQRMQAAEAEMQRLQREYEEASRA